MHVASQEGRFYLGMATACVHGALTSDTVYQVFRPGTVLRDPQNGKVMAHEGSSLPGSVKLVPAGLGVDAHTFNVDTVREMGVGDLPVLAATHRRCARWCAVRVAVNRSMRVMSIHAGVTYAIELNVTVNRARRRLMSASAALSCQVDPASRVRHGRAQLKMPDEQNGSLFIFRVQRTSHGLE
jgi:hypothetical protein